MQKHLNTIFLLMHPSYYNAAVTQPMTDTTSKLDFRLGCVQTQF